MVSTSKILTVSYGTFSCTLEGFDDSFETMKAIAEYFRDLAADDRYFGAEPPTPDADMLARIAEREIARRVEAHEEHGKIHLKADERAGVAEALTHAAPVAAPVAEPAAVEEAEAPEAEPVAEEIPAEEAPATAEEAEVPEEAAPEEAVAEQIEAEPVAEAVEPEEVAETSVEEVETQAAELQEAPEAEIEALVSEEDSPEAPEEPTEAAVAEDAEPTETEKLETLEEAVDAEPVKEDAIAYDEDQTADLEEETEDSSAIAAFLADAEADEAAAIEQPAPEVEPDVETAEAETTEILPEQDETEAEAVAADLVQDASAEQEADSVAEKLRRIRSVVSQSDLDYEVSEYTEDEHAQDVESTPSDELDALLDSADEYEPDVSAAAVASDEGPVEAEELAQDVSLDAVMDNLAEASGEEAAPEIEVAEVSEDEAAEEADEEIASTGVSVDEDTLSQLLADATPVGETPQAPLPEIAADLDEDTAEDLQDEDAPESLFADLADVLETEDEEPVAEAPLVLGEEARVEEPAEETPPRPLNARVLKMKRADFEDAIAQGMIEEEADADDEALLSPEEEADLQRELAEVEAELAEADTLQDIEDAEEIEASDEIEEAELLEDEPKSVVSSDEEAEEDEPQDVAESLREVLDEDEEAEPKPRRGLSRLLGMGKREPEDEERIFEEADSQMGDKDASMRRTAIQHLRAAVAATKAEKSAGVDVDKGVDETPYRTDLAEVVRPRRPSAAAPTTRSERPSEQRPAPLKLVAEQRVDKEHAPVRPRRVATAPVPATSAQSEDGGFTEFARDMGATELSDLLEAAAAYMSDVEGHAEFTRPMLMGKLKEVKSDSYSREDGLRSFGQLLREGKLRKLKGGRFSATDETEFRAEARNVG